MSPSKKSWADAHPMTRNEERVAALRALQPAVNIIAAQAWDEGHVAGLNNALQHEGGEFIENPYTSEEPT